MKLYIDQEITHHYEVEVSEEDLLKACRAQDIEPDDGESMEQLLSRLDETFAGELVLTALVGQATAEDSSETWTCEDWEN